MCYLFDMRTMSSWPWTLKTVSSGSLVGLRTSAAAERGEVRETLLCLFLLGECQENEQHFGEVLAGIALDLYDRYISPLTFYLAEELWYWD